MGSYLWKVLCLSLFFFFGFNICYTATSGNENEAIQKVISILEAKADKDNDYIPDRLGDTVTVRGRVTVSSGVIYKKGLKIAIQDGSAGIFIFNLEYSGSKITVGDSLNVTGVISQSNGLTQLVNPFIIFADTANRIIPKPLPFINNRYEEYEGQLVTATGYIINKLSARTGDYLFVAPVKGNDTTFVAFNPKSHANPALFNKYRIGQVVKISGIITQNDSGDSYKGNYMILPCREQDIKVVEHTTRFYYLIIANIAAIALLILAFNIRLRNKVRQRARQLKESELKFSGFANASTMGITIHQDGGFVYMNRAGEEISKLFEKGELNNMFIQLLDSKDYSSNGNELRKNNFQSEISATSAEGKNIWLSYRITPFPWGKKEAIAITFNNISEKKEAEEKILKNRLSLKEAQQIAKMGSWELDMISQKVTWSDNYFRLLGLEPGEIWPSYDYFKSRVHPDDLILIDQSLEKIHKTGLANEFDFRIIFPDNSFKWFQNIITPFFENDILIKLKGVIIDINDFKRSVEALEESEHKFRSLFENHSAIKLLIDPETGAIMDANEAAADFYGWTRDTLKQMTIQQINLLPVNVVLNEMGKVKTSRQNHFEFRHRRADGSVRDVEVFSSNVIFEGKDFLHSIIQDVTEKKKLYDELVVAKNRAEEGDRLKTAFLNNISHEIRTPMNGILGFAEMLKTPGLSLQEKEEFIKVIDQSGQRMLNTITSIIEISRIETGQVELMVQKNNLNKMLRKIYLDHKPEAGLKGLELLNFCGLADENAEVNTDFNKLGQVLKNLIANAIKFTETGTVWFGYEVERRKLQFYVQDTGIGLTPGQKDLIFKRFAQGNTSLTRNYEGVGLGLSIAMAYVEMLGGKIRVESEFGKGSSFYFDIPYIPAPGSTEDLTTDKLPDTQLSGHLLIVEDEQVCMQLLKVYLRKSKLDLLFATNGKEAIEMVKNRPEIEMVLMDLRMPVMDGFEATKKIKAMRPELPVITQTAFAFSDDLNKAKAAGCDGYITKPIKKEKLVKIISKYLEK